MAPPLRVKTEDQCAPDSPALPHMVIGAALQVAQLSAAGTDGAARLRVDLVQSYAAQITPSVRAGDSPNR